MSLFGGTTTETGPAPYIAPPSLSIASTIGTNPTGTQGPAAIGPPTSPAAAAPVTNNFNLSIQALDSKSIVDNADAIATAVQTALLNSHSLADTISQI